jgi:hypothetical protein
MKPTMPRSSVVSLGMLLVTITKGDGTAFVIEGFCARK